MGFILSDIWVTHAMNFTPGWHNVESTIRVEDLPGARRQHFGLGEWQNTDVHEPWHR